MRRAKNKKISKPAFGKVKQRLQKEGPAISAEEFLALKKPKGDLILEIVSERVSLTSLDRIYWPEEQLTKFDLLSYYLKLSSYILPYLQPPPPILPPSPLRTHSP